ncbi:hypothetical protein JCM19237_342 [Photobacterium aphoticum]|uniref:Phage tail collar domain-containing protein n=1 Tax=Photobacterium aphoticum TaxID=754436 RepID=A0A090RKF3_9GAMM|nr:hypothetical protein JCM19237_342 [Photobacterium aphoticum]
MAFTKLPLPKGYLQCDGREFDPILYPELHTHLGVNTTPNMTDKYLKGIGEGISPLTTVPWMIPEHSHNVSSSLGSTRLQRSFNTGGGGTHNHRLWSYDSDGEGKAGGLGTWSAKSGVGTALNSGGFPGQQYMNGDSAGHKIVEDSGNHSHSINVDFGSHGHSLSVTASGIKEALNKGNTLDVDHVTVVFGIQQRHRWMIR